MKFNYIVPVYWLISSKENANGNLIFNGVK